MDQIRVLMLQTRIVDGTEYEAGRFYMVSETQAMLWLNEADPACALEDELEAKAQTEEV